MRRIGIVGTLVAAAALLVVAGCGGTGRTSVRAAPLFTHGTFPGTTQRVHLSIRPEPAAKLLQRLWWQVSSRPAPDERVVGSNFAVRPGDPVTVSVRNYTTSSHTFTSKELGLSIHIRPGSPGHPVTTTFRFVALHGGVYRWYCLVPCDGYMGGNVYAIVGDPAM